MYQINYQNNYLLFRKSKEEDIPQIWNIILQAKEQMHQAGSKQWQDGYPTIKNIQNDILEKCGFVLCNKNQMIVYGSIITSGEPSYLQIKGKWLYNGPYIVVHRLAVINEMKHRGFASLFFNLAEQYALSNGIWSFRVDTNYDNFYMLQLLKKQQFTYCGEVSYGERGKRLAFEKVIKHK